MSASTSRTEAQGGVETSLSTPQSATRRRTWLAIFVLVPLFWACIFVFAAKAAAHVPGCHSRVCDQRIHQKRRLHWQHTHPWLYAWHHLSAGGRYWARCVSRNESNNHRIARASGFLSYFQWTSSTWHDAGGSGNPEFSASWYEQAVRAWHWHLSHPSGQWPNTGERGLCGS